MRTILEAPVASPPPIVSGSSDSAHPAVAALVAQDGELEGTFCSASLIDPEQLLTAGHCAEAALSWWDEGLDIAVVFGPQVGSDEVLRLGVLNLELHPAYSAATLEADLAVVQLTRAVHDIEPLVMEGEELNAEALSARSVLAVGYGQTSDSAGDAGTRRQATLPVDHLDEGFIWTEEGRSNLCNGDSGGPTLDPETGAIIAVNSFVLDADGGSSPCSQGSAGLTRLDAWWGWLSGEADDAHGVGGGAGTAGGGSSGVVVEKEAPATCAQLSAPPAPWVALLLAAALRRSRCA
jgi:secreted trypsin-like serine protease